MARTKLCLLSVVALILFFADQQAQGVGGRRMHDGILTRSWEPIALPEGDTENERLEGFLNDHRRLLGLDDNPDVQLRLVREDQTGIGQRYVLEQTAYDLPVFEAEVVAVVIGDHIRTLFNALSAADFRKMEPALSPSEALSMAENAVAGTLYRSPPEIMLGYSPDGRLTYRLQMPGLDPPADWEVWIDAISGEILRNTDRRVFVDGSGRIFDPDPKTAIESDTLSDQGDANAAIPEEAYSDVTLYELDDPVGGYYYLDGPFVSTRLTSNRAAEPAPDFFYWRQDDRFEEVMVYYHIDHTQRYFQNELQTYNANNRQQPCNVNGTADDNSWYSPFDGSITYGYGGVDDAEDADVIIHEYGHAVQYDINFFWYGGHTGAMGEGYGDYLAGSYSLTVNPNFQPNWVFNWDGHNEFWAGRILNADYHYPEDAGGEVHDSGQLWSAGLIDVWWDIPDVVAWDRIVLQHHFLIGMGALMEDAAEAILVTELELYGGIYRQIIVDNFAARGFIDPDDYYPNIVHDPLPDTEDTLQTEFEVIAQITSDVPLDEESLQLFWRAGQGAYNDVTLLPTGNPNEYEGVIPGPFNNQTISYYLTAADTLQMAAFLPANAPAETFQFYVGPDPYPPEIVWTDSLGETVFPAASLPVSAVVTDNIGIQSVELRWKVGQGDWQSAPMTNTAADTFTGTLTYNVLTLDQTVQYFVRAVDASSQNNTADGATRNFTIGTHAELEDFEGPMGPWIFDGDWGTTNQFAHSGTYSIEDSPGVQYASNSDSWAQWDQSWDLTPFSSATLTFWEKHLLEDGADWGRLEISVDGGLWTPLLEITGSENQWYEREVELDDYCGGLYDDLRFRFRTTTDAQNNFFGWYIDDLSITVDIIVGTEDNNTAGLQSPKEFKLYPAFPNPFNPSTAIRFDLPRASWVTLDIFDINGRWIPAGSQSKTHLQAGTQEITFDGSGLSSGIYFYRLKAGEYEASGKMVLLK